ncbi:MAG: putative Serine/threonine-protein kinase Nek4, partial [Streblomastix strix]
MHEILTQKKPFRGKNYMELINYSVNGDFQAQIDPHYYSHELIQLIDQMHKVKPEERPTIQQILAHPRLQGTVYRISRKDRTEFICRKIPCKSKEEFDKMEKEITVLSELQHPNIVGFIDAFYYQGSYFIVNEICNGGNLHDFYMDKKKKGYYISEDDAWRFIYEMTSAIAYLHKHNIKHLKLKPRKVLLTSDLTIKVSDFGIEQRIIQDQFNFASMSTTHPELTTTRQQSYSADIWGIGLIMQEILSQEIPFKDQEHYDFIFSLMNGKVQKLINPKHYSNELIDLVTSMRGVNPQKRPHPEQILAHPHFKPPIQQQYPLQQITPNQGQLPHDQLVNESKELSYIDNFSNYEEINWLASSEPRYKIKRRTDGKLFTYNKISCLIKEEEEQIKKQTLIHFHLHHENIIEIVEAFLHEYNFYIIMELAQGENLSDFYTKKKNGEFITEEEA